MPLKNEIEFNGQALRKGDKVRISVEGFVEESYGELNITIPGYGSWWVQKDHQVEILERARPKDNYDVGTVLQRENAYGAPYRYVKQGDGTWAYIGFRGALDVRRTWDYLLNNSDNGKSLKILSASMPVA